MQKKTIVMILFFVIVGIFIYVTWHFLLKSKVTPQPVPRVSVTKVQQKDVTLTIQTIGTVEAYSFVEVKSMVTGPLVRTGFKEGDIVKKDQILFQIDPRPFVASLNQAKADLARNEAILRNNELQVRRNAQLLKKGYVARQDYDTLVANLKTARANIEASRAAYANAKLQLDYATIRASLTGKTGNILLKTGSIIKANDTASLVTIRQINPIYVTFTLPQDKLSSINLSTEKVVKALLNDKDVEIGKLTFIDNTIDPATGSIQMKATFANEDHRLWPGQYVQIIFPLERIEKAMLIPSLAVLTGPQGFYVYVVDANNVAHTRKVKPGSAIHDQTIIQSGLGVNERVIVAGQLRVKDGAKVELNEP